MIMNQLAELTQHNCKHQYSQNYMESQHNQDDGGSHFQVAANDSMEEDIGET